jgi:hypothetical protein
MGTRNLTCVIKDGRFRIAQCGQWDGYIEGSGKGILEFLRTTNLDDFSNRIENTSFISAKEQVDREEAAGFGDFLTMEQADKYNKLFPHITRDTGWRILKAVMTCDKLELQDNAGFAHDSLFCEWAYVVDLDRYVFEVYKGFNQDFSAHKGVFGSVPFTPEQQKKDKYSTVALLKSYSLRNLPTFEQLVKDCKEQDNDE